MHILRVDGSDGPISCRLQTEVFLPGDTNSPYNAITNVDYEEKDFVVEFGPGEVEKTV